MFMENHDGLKYFSRTRYLQPFTKKTQKLWQMDNHLFKIKIFINQTKLKVYRFFDIIHVNQYFLTLRKNGFCGKTQPSHGHFFSYNRVK